ncbi:hypothetical protein QC762_304527 [Podospora pseudocomata]|uniref:Uncharacterized protein n=1 Tax=Podospora pseudocomata TaxID=2093779 RepID=A0ABR0GIV9_9PEZI|nr:hypothetical protein QC762_304527 [Podospora pseudocomata]
MGNQASTLARPLDAADSIRAHLSAGTSRPQGTAGTRAQDTVGAPPHDGTRHPSPQETASSYRPGPQAIALPAALQPPSGPPQSQQHSRSCSPPRSDAIAVPSSSDLISASPTNQSDHETNPSLRSFWRSLPPNHLTRRIFPKPEPERPPDTDEFDPSHPPSPKPFNPDCLGHQVGIYSAQTRALGDALDLIYEDLDAHGETVDTLAKNLGEYQRALATLLATPVTAESSPRARARASKAQRCGRKCFETIIAGIQERLSRLPPLGEIIREELNSTLRESLEQDSDAAGRYRRAHLQRRKEEADREGEKLAKERLFTPMMAMDLSSRSRWKSTKLPDQNEELQDKMMAQQTEFLRWKKDNPGVDLPEDYLMSPPPRWWGAFLKRGAWNKGGELLREELRFEMFGREIKKMQERVELDELLTRETRGVAKRRGEVWRLRGEVRRAMEDAGYGRDKFDWGTILGLEKGEEEVVDDGERKSWRSLLGSWERLCLIREGRGE